MAAFDPISALFGGLLIGVAAVLLMVLIGRIAGISGILGGALAMNTLDRGWRLAFIAGLIFAPVLMSFLGHPLPQPQMPSNWIEVLAAGLLVGFGARLGGGCTSGHGVCGIARLSARSLAATAIFMASAIVVVAITRLGFGG
jgi:uncharacterized membrane protein YedE/YeeE